MSTTISLPPESVRLDRNDFYRGDIDAVYAMLRRDSPVYWQPAHGGYWILTKYDDIKHVSSNTDVFRIGYGMALQQRIHAEHSPNPLPGGLEDLIGNELPRTAEVAKLIMAQGNGFVEAETLVQLDPPRHGRMRKLISKAFTPRVIGRLEGWVRELTIEALDKIEPDVPFDLVAALSVPVPMLVIASLLGVPESDRMDFRHWSDSILAGTEPEATPEAIALAGKSLADFFAYFDGQFEARLANPTDDLLSMLTLVEFEGEKLSRPSQLANCLQLLLAGNETTRNTISGAFKALAERPDQLQALAANPDLLQSGAVDEFLRWVTPVMNFGRTAAVDTEIRGVEIKAGDFVHMVYSSGNRDESVFDDADTFDVTRAPDPMHLTFGYAQHNCLGQNIARLELRVIFEELFKRFSVFEVLGPPVYVDSILFNAIDHMTVRVS